MQTNIQLHAMRIEVDDAGMMVEREGFVYHIAWASRPAQPPTLEPECTCVRDFPYPDCRVHPGGPRR